MARDYDVSALGLAPWQGLPLDSAGRWKVSLADEISSLPFHTFNPTWWPAQEQRVGQWLWPAPGWKLHTSVWTRLTGQLVHHFMLHTHPKVLIRGKYQKTSTQCGNPKLGILSGYLHKLGRQDSKDIGSCKSITPFPSIGPRTKNPLLAIWISKVWILWNGLLHIHIVNSWLKQLGLSLPPNYEISILGT